MNAGEHPLACLRKAGLMVVLAGDSFRVIGLASLPPERREKCIQYFRQPKQEIRTALIKEQAMRDLPAAALRGAGFELTANRRGELIMTLRRGCRMDAGKRRQWEQYARGHQREVLASAKPCKGWKPTGPGGGCATLEEFLQELEKERRRGVITFCPFHGMWLCLKDCPKWCGRWNEPLSDKEREYWAALWPEKKPSAA